MMKLRLANLEYLIDINDLHGELSYITVEAGQIRIGAMTRHRELSESDELAAAFPIFRDAEQVIADRVVRNRGTLGGSLCQADPSEDLSAVCTTLDASCVINGGSGERAARRAAQRPRGQAARSDLAAVRAWAWRRREGGRDRSPPRAGTSGTAGIAASPPLARGGDRWPRRRCVSAAVTKTDWSNAR